MSEQCLTIVLSTKPLQKLNGTDRQTGGKDHALSQADALTKNYSGHFTIISPNNLYGVIVNAPYSILHLWNVSCIKHQIKEKVQLYP